MRCLSLADALSRQGVRTEFICRQKLGDLISAVKRQGYRVHVLDSVDASENDTHSSWLGVSQQQDAEEAITRLREISIKPNWLVVDHYAIDSAWEQCLRPYVENIMVLDDLANRTHECEVLLDQTLGRVENDYQGYVPQNAHLLLGPQYALLRDDFRRLRDQSLERRRGITKIKNVLVSLGGSDPHNITGWLLEIVKDTELELNFDVILGPGMLHRDTLLNQNYPNFIRIHDAVKEFAGFVSRADIAIGAAGTTSWERCCLGLPTLLIVTADNQGKIAEELERAGAAKIVGQVGQLNRDHLVENLQKWKRNPKIVSEVSQRAADICDGYGVDRVVSFLDIKNEWQSEVK